MFETITCNTSNCALGIKNGNTLSIRSRQTKKANPRIELSISTAIDLSAETSRFDQSAHGRGGLKVLTNSAHWDSMVVYCLLDIDAQFMYT